MIGKTVLITGGTSGIGVETARALAGLGASVVIVSRNEARCATVVEQLRAETDNPQVAYIAADLSSLAGIRAAAQQFLNSHDRLDVLINNAGGIFMSRQVSADGLEMTFALNHMGYFLLTTLLLEVLQTSAPARVVNVSSNAHRGATLDLTDLQMEKRYSGFAAYARSKLMNILFTYELARRLEGTGVTANALHPGFVATSFGLNNGSPWRELIRLTQRFGLTPAAGARTSIFLASSPAMAGVTGRYFVREREVRSSPITYDRELAARLWEVSAALAGLREGSPVTLPGLIGGSQAA